MGTRNTLPDVALSSDQSQSKARHVRIMNRDMSVKRTEMLFRKLKLNQGQRGGCLRTECHHYKRG